MAEPPIVFTAEQRPALDPGDYEITVKHTVNQQPKPFGATRTFSVAGERFTLAPEAIRAVFPPQGSVGDHSSVLPHVVLRRATLPWERDPGGGGAHPPWLALLLFTEAERPPARTTTLGGLAAEGRLPASAVAPERHESADDPVTVIDVPAALLADLLPGYDELRLLAHTRSVDAGTGAGDGESDGDDAAGAVPGEVAVVVGSRLPPSGATSTVHLVSLEHRFRASAPGATPAFDPDPAPGAGVPVVSLASWTFSCLSADHTFAALVRDLSRDPAPMRLGVAGTGTGEADRYVAQGYLPLRHQLRDGTRSIAWYRGPLTVAAVEVAVASGVGAPPSRTADALLSLDAGTGMFDVSHASAWQLGRLLALQSPDIAASVYGWRRRRAQAAARRIPPGYPLAQAEIDVAPPGSLVTWLQGLAELDGVPFGYLVPDERLLPVESIRFVGLDQVWVSHLLDGACSVGRVGRADADLDAGVPPLVSLPTVTGALIRSEVIAGYPGLLIDAFADRAGARPLPVFRIARLGPEMLLCLFRGQLARLDLHQPPESRHLGLEPGPVSPAAPDGTVVKALRGPAPLTAGPVPLRARRVVPVRDVADAMAQALGTPAAGITSAELALHLSEAAQRVTFLAPG